MLLKKTIKTTLQKLHGRVLKSNLNLCILSDIFSVYYLHFTIVANFV